MPFWPSKINLGARVSFGIHFDGFLMDFVSILAPFGSLLAPFGSLLAPFGSIQGVTSMKTVHYFLPFLIYKAQHARLVVACDVDPPPPSGGQTRRVKPNFGFCRSPNSQTPKASAGQPSAADPPSKIIQRSSWPPPPHFFGFFNFFARSKIITNRTSIKSSQNLKNRTPGCPKLDIGAIMDDFWHHFFD